MGSPSLARETMSPFRTLVSRPLSPSSPSDSATSPLRSQAASRQMQRPGAAPPGCSTTSRWTRRQLTSWPDALGTSSEDALEESPKGMQREFESSAGRRALGCAVAPATDATEHRRAGSLRGHNLGPQMYREGAAAYLAAIQAGARAAAVLGRAVGTASEAAAAEARGRASQRCNGQGQLA